MKGLLKLLARRCGFRIERIRNQAASGDPFDVMRRLSKGKRQLSIFDVGAHHGSITLEFRRVFPSAIIYAFEPFERSHAKLSQVLENDTKANALNFGFSNHAGLQAFKLNAHEQTNSLLPTDPRSKENWGEGFLETREVVEARFHTLDEFAETEKISRIDILKLDVQGAESLVLQGARKLCVEKRIGLIYTEIITQPTYIGQKRLDQSLKDFYDNGFEVYNFFNPSIRDDGTLRQMDVIFRSIDG